MEASLARDLAALSQKLAQQALFYLMAFFVDWNPSKNGKQLDTTVRELDGRTVATARCHTQWLALGRDGRRLVAIINKRKRRKARTSCG